MATLCDGIGLFEKREALRLLREGLRLGLVSSQRRGVWPQNVWNVVVVDDVEVVVEAALDNQETGSYHGYPLLSDDPFHDVVITKRRERLTWTSQ